jgi:hypothetical protein
VHVMDVSRNTYSGNFRVTLGENPQGNNVFVGTTDCV